jgi:hypothetical protein
LGGERGRAIGDCRRCAGLRGGRVVLVVVGGGGGRPEQQRRQHGGSEKAGDLVHGFLIGRCPAEVERVVGAVDGRSSVPGGRPDDRRSAGETI